MVFCFVLKLNSFTITLHALGFRSRLLHSHAAHFGKPPPGKEVNWLKKAIVRFMC